MTSLSVDQRKALVRQYLEIAWNSQAVDERNDVDRPVANLAGSQQEALSYPDIVLSPDCVYLGDERLNIPLAELRAIVRTTFPDIRLTISDLVVEGEKVVVRW